MSDIRYTPTAAVSRNTPLSKADSASGVKPANGHTRKAAIGMGQTPKAKNSISEFFSKVTLPVRNLFSRLASRVSAQFKEPELSQDQFLSTIKALKAKPNQVAIKKGIERSLKKFDTQLSNENQKKRMERALQALPQGKKLTLNSHLKNKKAALELDLKVQQAILTSTQSKGQSTDRNKAVIANLEKALSGLNALQGMLKTAIETAVRTPLPPRNTTPAPAAQRQTTTPLPKNAVAANIKPATPNPNIGRPLPPIPVAASNNAQTDADAALYEALYPEGEHQADTKAFVSPFALAESANISTNIELDDLLSEGGDNRDVSDSVDTELNTLADALANSTLENPFSEFPEADVLDDKPPPVPPRRGETPPALPPREEAQDNIDLANMTDEQLQAYMDSLPPPPPPSGKILQQPPTPPPFPTIPPTPSNKAEPNPSINTPSRGALLGEILSKGASGLKPKEDQKPVAPKPRGKETNTEQQNNQAVIHAAVTGLRKYLAPINNNNDDDVDVWEDDEEDNKAETNPSQKTISTPIASSAASAPQAPTGTPPSAAPQSIKQPAPIVSQPPAPPPPPSPKATVNQSASPKTDNARSDLMSAIQQGKNLKKAADKPQETPTKDNPGLLSSLAANIAARDVPVSPDQETEEEEEEPGKWD